MILKRKELSKKDELYIEGERNDENEGSSVMSEVCERREHAEGNNRSLRLLEKYQRLFPMVK
jgi:hypothetical protein